MGFTNQQKVTNRPSGKDNITGRALAPDRAALSFRSNPTSRSMTKSETIVVWPSKCTQLSSAQKLRKLCNLFSDESLSFPRGA